MPMHRFFVPPHVLKEDAFRLPADTARQLSRVLRARPGEEVALFDGTGTEYIFQLDEIKGEEAWGRIVSRQEQSSEPDHRVTVCLSLLNKPDKYEWALQKCTELGAYAFQPVAPERAISGPPEKGRRERWQRIIQEAAEQSGRVQVPALAETVSLREALEGEKPRLSNEPAHLALMPVLGARPSLGEVLRGLQPDSLSLYIGPEGGFTDAEIHLAGQSGVSPVSLGPRTLRAETAAVAALALVLYQLGDMGETSL